MFTPQSNVDPAKAIQELRFINQLLKITPVRGKMGELMARLATALFLKVAPKNPMVNIGVGFPEEVARLLVENHFADDIVFTTEAGSYGGLPAPGIFFGAAINPIRLETSSKMFQRYQKELDVAILGFLQVDKNGNVNVSKRGPNMLDYVGPGGFPDIVSGAHTVIFIGKWMAKAKFSMKKNSICLEQAGTPKFVDQVNEITFNGQEALRQGKRVYYVTNVGIFQLTPEGLELKIIMPGIDVERDILAHTQAKIILPKNNRVPIVDTSLMKGISFRFGQDVDFGIRPVFHQARETKFAQGI